MEEIIKKIEKECRGIFEAHKNKINNAHNWDHVERVRKTALKITELYKKNHKEEINKEEINKEEIEIAVLLHDIGRYMDKEGEHAEWSYKFAEPIIEKYKTELSKIIDTERVLKIIRNHSFYKKDKEDFIDKEMYEDIEFQIVTDADKIDSFGPIGILRAPLDERFNSIEKQLDHIKKKTDPEKFEIRTNEGKSIGVYYKEYLCKFLQEYEKQK